MNLRLDTFQQRHEVMRKKQEELRITMAKVLERLEGIAGVGRGSLEEGREAEKAKWSQIYCSTLKEKKKEIHEGKVEVSSEVSESGLESEPPSQFPPATLPPKQPTPLSSPPSLGYESRKENEMKNLGGKVAESESKPKKAPQLQPPMLS
ncbi:hypothetical protein Lser_V15G19362 [Lactuca serriola]